MRNFTQAIAVASVCGALVVGAATTAEAGRGGSPLAIQNAVSLADHRARVGQTVEVLVEGPSKAALKHEAERSPLVQLTGRTMTDHIVVFEGNERLVGRTVPVVVEEATAFTLFGTVLTGEQVGVAEGGGGAGPKGGKQRIALPLL